MDDFIEMVSRNVNCACFLLDSSIKVPPSRSHAHKHTHVLFHSPDGAVNYVVNRLASLADCDQQRQPVFSSYSAFHSPRKSEFWVRNDDIQRYRRDSVPFVRWRSDCYCCSHCQPLPTYSITEHCVIWWKLMKSTKATYSMYWYWWWQCCCHKLLKTQKTDQAANSQHSAKLTLAVNNAGRHVGSLTLGRPRSSAFPTRYSDLKGRFWWRRRSRPRKIQLPR